MRIIVTGVFLHFKTLLRVMESMIGKLYCISMTLKEMKERLTRCAVYKSHVVRLSDNYEQC